MKFEHNPISDRDDEGGLVTVTIETEAEALDWMRGYERTEDPREQVRIMDSVPFTRQKGKANRPYFRCYGSLEIEMSRPYADRLERITGYRAGADLPDLDFTPAIAQLCATRILYRLWTEHGHFCYEAWTEAEPWAGKTAPEYADALALKYVEDEIGERPAVPEFIQNKNGTYSPNPKYATGYRPPIRPTCKPKIWRHLAEWWIGNQATEAQKAMLARYSRYGKDDDSFPLSLNNYQGFPVDDYKGYITWEQFRAAGSPATVC